MAYVDVIGSVFPLLSRQSLNGNANDSSGNGLNGTVNGATFGADGPWTGRVAATFDGIDDSITVPISRTGNFLLVAYTYLTSAGSYPMVATFGDYSTPDFRFGDGNRFPQFGTAVLSAAQPLNTWQQWICLRFQGTLYLFLEGVLIAQVDTTAFNNPFTQMMLGRRFDNAGAFPGRIAEVSVHNPDGVLNVDKSDVEDIVGDFAALLSANESESSGGDVTAPTITSIEIPPIGNVIELTASEAITGGGDDFTINASGGSVDATYVSGSTILIYSLDRTILGTETVTVDHVAGSWEDSSGNALASFTDKPVTNNAGQFETAQAGDYATGSTWVGGIKPDANAHPTINHALTLAASETVAGMVMNANITITNPAATFTTTNDVTQANAIFDAGDGKIVLDTTANDVVWTQGTANNQTNCQIIASGENWTISKTGSNAAYFQAGIGFSGTTGWNLNAGSVPRVAVSDLGNGSSFGIETNSYGDPGIEFHNVIFNNCWEVRQQTGINFADSGEPIILEGLRWTNSPEGSRNLVLRVNNTGAESDDYLLSNCSFDKRPQISGEGLKIRDIYFDTNFEWLNGTPYAEWILHRVVARLNETFYMPGPPKYVYLWADHNEGNPHFANNPDSSGQIYIGWYFEYSGFLAVDGGDGLYKPGLADGSITAQECVVLRSISDGYAGTNLFGVGGDGQIRAINCTIIGKSQPIFFAEDNTSTGEVLNRLWNCLSYSDTPGTAYLIYDLHAPTHSRPALLAVGGAVNNAVYNGATYIDPVTAEEYIGMQMRHPAGDTLTPITTNPNLIDPNSCLALWGIAKGVAESQPEVDHSDPTWTTWIRESLDAVRDLFKNDPTLWRTEYQPWLSAKIAPTAITHDGIGAFPLYTADTPPEFSNFTTNAAGTETTFTISKSGCTPTEGTTGFTFIDFRIQPTSWDISGPTGTLYHDVIYRYEEFDILYDGNIEDAEGNAAESNSYTVTNNSTQILFLNECYVSTTGNDTNDGSVSNPLETIQAAVETTNPQANIYLKGGDTFNENILLDDSGRYFRAYGTGLPVWNGNANSPLIIEDVSDWKVIGINIKMDVPLAVGMPLAAKGVIHIICNATERLQNIEITHNLIEGGHIGIFATADDVIESGAENILIEHNEITGQSEFGILFQEYNQGDFFPHWSGGRCRYNHIHDVTGNDNAGAATGSVIVISRSDQNVPIGNRKGWDQGFEVAYNKLHTNGTGGVFDSGGIFGTSSNGLWVHDNIVDQDGSPSAGINLGRDSTQCVYERNTVVNCMYSMSVDGPTGPDVPYTNNVSFNLFINPRKADFTGTGLLHSWQAGNQLIEGDQWVDFHNNTIHIAADIYGACVRNYGDGWKNRNNIYVCPLWNTEEYKSTNPPQLIQGNSYWGTNAGGGRMSLYKWVDGGGSDVRIGTLADARAQGFELPTYGKIVDPGLGDATAIDVLDLEIDNLVETLSQYEPNILADYTDDVVSISADKDLFGRSIGSIPFRGAIQPLEITFSNSLINSEGQRRINLGIGIGL